VLNRGLALVLRLTRREPMPQPLSLHGIVVACGWCVPTWLLYGVSTWALARDLGPAGFGMLLRGTGAFAASWSIGFLLLVAPAGAGIREAAMIVLLSTSLPTAQATVIALVSRLLIVLGDVFWGVVALLGRPAGRQVRRRLAGSAARPGRP
jgi:uncharacterized membrane protein YbhN (UPF0104 family)